MHVFRRRFEVIRIILRTIQDGLQPGMDLLGFARVQHLCSNQGVAMRDARSYVCDEQPAVECKRPVEFSEPGISFAGKPSTPQIGRLFFAHRFLRQTNQAPARSDYSSLTPLHKVVILCKYAEKMQ